MKKKFSVFMFLILISGLILAACGKEDSENNGNQAEGNTDQSSSTEVAYEAEAIDPEVDVCDICAMAVADGEHATQIVLKNDRVLKFDDLGCLFEWVETNGEEEVGAKFVRDFNTKEWTLLEDAVFVFDEHIETPMAYGVISFQSEEKAKQFIEDEGMGELLTAEDLKDHKWEMMDHDHH